MIRLVRRFAAVFLASLVIALPARATTSTLDYTDIWWAGLAENGWGVTVSQQGDIVFATFFIYGPDGSARWFSAALALTAGSAGQSTFTGDLFRSTGTFYGANPYVGASGTKVGTATMAFNSGVTGTLSYTIDGVAVVKSISRQTFRGNNLAGSYTGGLVSNRTGCAGSVPNGVADAQGQVFVTHNDPSVAIEVDLTDLNGNVVSVCVFRGSYTALGRLGNLATGTSWSCAANGTTIVQGTSFSITNIDAQLNGFHGNFVGNDSNSCTYSGRFGAIRNP